MIPKLLMLVLVFITSLLIRTQESQASIAKPGCQEMCGNVTIPYPFGIGSGCYLHESFEVFCSRSSQDHVPLWFANNQEFTILELSTNLMRVIHESTAECAFGGTGISTGGGLILDQYFSFSKVHNVYVGVGCNIMPYFSFGVWKALFCLSLCNDTTPNSVSPAIGCNGFNGCCQLTMPENIVLYNFYIKYNINSSCAHAFISENNAPILFNEKRLKLPVALNWVVELTTCHQASKTGKNLCGRNSQCIDSTNAVGYNCHCKKGYKGNPYLPNGCQDIKDCPKQSNNYCEDGETCVYTHGTYKCIAQHNHKSSVSVASTVFLGIIIGLSAFGAIGYGTYIKLIRIRKSKIKKKLFEKNGGHLLTKQISANKTCVMTIKVYTAENMEKATENFSRIRIIGKGGQGTVYKGLFLDGTVVAIKKLNVIDADQIERFVNEVFILSQINHRNIVKLLGCCLEYEAPLLVYEYLANNTLFEHLHEGSGHVRFLWNDRIRMAREVAEALAYLHSYASPAVLHRDIKPNNILLDQTYKAVVSDFGLSKLVPLSRTHLTTQVEGTFGYLDPEYFQTGKLTAKSDVYSFGVVLTELLTRKKSISSSESGEGLLPRFKYLVKHNRFVETLDEQVVQEAMMDDVVLLARLAKRCMKTKSKKRPSMKEVVAYLDKLSLVQPEHPSNGIIEHELTTEEFLKNTSLKNTSLSSDLTFGHAETN